MAWEHLSINRPHLVYIILGGFTSLFMLCSSVIKERLYIGEATVATLCGIIFGPIAANLINPLDWGNTDNITLEFSRIVLVVQCFAVGVELPKAYMERHWKSVTFLLIPVMTFGWLITSLFIWGLFHTHLNWLDSLCIAACVTATDPVLASSVVGKGKFAKRVPKHLRDLLSAESGCNDGMAFPFVYLAVYLIRYHLDAQHVTFHWFCYTILYECVFGAIFGVAVGYAARRAVRYAHEHDLIDRESFLVFYFVLALFCAGAGSMLGMDDLLVGFAAGVGFSNDGWFTEKTEEAHVSNVIDLLINLAFFVYFGTIIPWDQFNSEVIGLTPWKLVVLGILVLFFRRIPIMLFLKPAIPDIKTWREALFAGHFGPIGVGGLFVAILARAELETESTTPLAELPELGFPHRNIIEMIWPITVFLVIVSIVVHGSSIAVFTLGKHINTLTLTLSYTQATEDGPTWMDRLPRIQSRSKSMMSRSSSFDEKSVPPGTLGATGFPGNFLRRQKEEDVRPSNRRKKWDAGLGPGGPVSQSAIAPQRSRQESDQRDSDGITIANQDSDTTNVPSREDSLDKKETPIEEVYQEGHKDIIEDAEGNVLEVRDTHGESKKERTEKDERDARRLAKEKHVKDGVSQDEHGNVSGDEEDVPPHAAAAPHTTSEEPSNEERKTGWRGRFGGLRRRDTRTEEHSPSKQPPKRGAARAYQFGNTIIVEDEDGEVLKKYDIPTAKKPQRPAGVDRQTSFVDNSMHRLANMGRYLGVPRALEGNDEDGPSEQKKRDPDEEDDERVRFRVSGGGRRMSKTEFIQKIQNMDPRARAQVVEDSNVPEAIKREARVNTKEHEIRQSKATAQEDTSPAEKQRNMLEQPPTHDEDKDAPAYDVSADLANTGKETAAQRRRRLASSTSKPDTSTVSSKSKPADQSPELLSPNDPSSLLAPVTSTTVSSSRNTSASKSHMDEGPETAAERRRREGALGMSHESGSDSDSESDVDGTGMRDLPPESSVRSSPYGGGRRSSLPAIEDEDEDEEEAEREMERKEETRRTGIRFAEGVRDGGNNGTGRLRWGANVGHRPGR